MKAALRGSASSGSGSSYARTGPERKPPNAGSFSLELAPAELHFPGCWGIPYLQHDFRLGRSPPRRNWNRTRPRGGRGVVLSAVVGEAASLGLAAALIGIPLGRFRVA